MQGPGSQSPKKGALVYPMLVAVMFRGFRWGLLAPSKRPSGGYRLGPYEGYIGVVLGCPFRQHGLGSYGDFLGSQVTLALQIAQRRSYSILWAQGRYFLYTWSPRVRHILRGFAR